MMGNDRIPARTASFSCRAFSREAAAPPAAAKTWPAVAPRRRVVYPVKMGLIDFLSASSTCSSIIPHCVSTSCPNHCAVYPNPAPSTSLLALSRPARRCSMPVGCCPRGRQDDTTSRTTSEEKRSRSRAGREENLSTPLYREKAEPQCASSCRCQPLLARCRRCCGLKIWLQFIPSKTRTAMKAIALSLSPLRFPAPGACTSTE